MNLVQKALAKILPPTVVERFLGPRFEPSNLSSTATAQTIQSAIREAENGDIQNLFRLYRDALMGDDHIQGELNKRKLAVLAQPLAILPRDKNNPDDIASAAAVRRMILDCENWNDGISAMLDGTLWPLAAVEKLFRPADAPAPGEPALQFTLRRLEPVNPQMFCFRWAYMTGGVGQGSATPIQNVGLGQTNGAYTIDLTKWEPWLKLWPVDQTGRIIYDTTRADYLDRDRYLVHRGHLMTQFRDNWGGPFRAILAWWLLRGLGRDWFGRYMERQGMPFIVGKTNVEDPAAIAFLEKAFALTSKLGGIVIGHEDQVELKEAALSGGADGHEKWINVCNSAISRAIVGQDLSGTAKPAGLGNGGSDLAADVRQDIRLLDQMRAGEGLEKQLVKQFLRINGLKGAVPRLVWGGLSEKDAAAVGALLVNLAQAGLEPTDEAITTVSEKVGFQLQRKAIVAPPGAAGILPAETQTFSAIVPHLGHPTDKFASENAAALSRQWQVDYGHLIAAIRASSSAEDLEQRLKQIAPHLLKGERTQIMEKVLQLSAASGAVTAKG